MLEEEEELTKQEVQLKVQEYLVEVMVLKMVMEEMELMV